MQRPDPSAGAAELLDDRATVDRLDPHGLLRRIEELPEQCAVGWRRAAALDLPARLSGARELVVLGMGGSAIAGDIVRALAHVSGRGPVHVVRDYDASPSLDERSLVVACSHSGDTEETLSAFDQALAAGSLATAVTTGGRLRQIAERRGVPVLTYEYQGEPRAALGHQLTLLLAVAERAALLPPQEEAVAEAVSLMREQRGQIGFGTPCVHNPAKQIAARLHRRLPVLVGAGVLAVAARRWKTQLNENSKSWAICEELLELGHNAIAGFGLPEQVVPGLHAVLLSHAALDARLLLRYEAVADELEAAGVSYERVEARGQGPLAQTLTAVYVGDLVSYYLGLLNEVEPAPVPALARLKARLAEREG